MLCKFHYDGSKNASRHSNEVTLLSLISWKTTEFIDKIKYKMKHEVKAEIAYKHI